LQKFELGEGYNSQSDETMHYTKLDKVGQGGCDHKSKDDSGPL